MESFAKSSPGKLFLKVLASGMESRFRYKFFSPDHILQGADLLPGQTVLEVGCGTGFFTLPAARIIGEKGRLVALDILAESVEEVSRKVQSAGIRNVQVVKGNTMDTCQEALSYDTVLLFGVIPVPMLPLARLLPEMRHILKLDGTLAVWPPVPGWLPQAITQTGLFSFSSKRNGVHNFIVVQ